MTTPEKGFWHKTKEVTDNLWEGTKNVTEDVWDGTKNMAGNIKNAFSHDDKEELYEETHYAADLPEEDVYEDFEVKTKITEKTKTHTKH